MSSLFELSPSTLKSREGLLKDNRALCEVGHFESVSTVFFFRPILFLHVFQPFLKGHIL